MSNTAPKWRAFEKLVGRIQHELAPAAAIAENERIMGRSGVARRIDVTVRQTVSAYPVLIAIDCKRHQRKIGVGYVSAFADQAKDVSASRAVLISNTGFTKGALAVAKTHDVVLQTQRLIRVPLPDRFAFGRDLTEIIAPHSSLHLGPRESTPYVGDYVPRDRLPTHDHRVAVAHSCEVMVQRAIRMAPQLVAFPVELHNYATAPSEGHRAAAGITTT